MIGVAANAQTTPAPAQPSQPAVAAPAQPAVAAPAAQPAKMTLNDLKKKHIDAVATLKKQQLDEIKALRDSMKGKPKTDIRKAVEAKKAEQKTALKELDKANKAEIAQYRKDHPAKKDNKKP
jgi:3-oxoacyl-ACP reductase-like protein